MPGNGFSVQRLANSGVRGIAFSLDQTRLYASSAGSVSIFDVATGSLLNTWAVGTSLGAISLSEDGAYLLAVESQTIGGNAVLHRIRVADGVVSTFATVSSRPFADVETLDGGVAMVSGSNNFLYFDISSGTFEFRGNPFGDYFIHESGRFELIVGEFAPAYYSIYDRLTGRFTNTQSPSTSGFSRGTVALSPFGNVVVARSEVYQLTFVGNQGFITATSYLDSNPRSYRFSGDGSILYASDGESLIAYDTSTWSRIETLTIGVPFGFPPAYSNRTDSLLVSADNSLFVQFDDTAGSVRLIDLRQRNESFVGTAGPDALAGGFGNDVYVVNDPGDTITELANQGRDTVYVNFTYALPANVEVLAADPVSGTADINLTGNVLANSLYGNAGINVLDGGGGNDVLIAYAGDDSLNGGTGNDTMAGGTGDDLYFVDSVSDDIVEAAGEGTDTVYTSLSYGLGTGMNIERLIADSAMGAVAINLFGNELANSIYGNAAANLLRGFDGNDVLIAYAGNDVLDGGAGNDTMIGGAGDDIYFVGSVGDDVAELVGEGIDTIYASISYGLGTGASIERLIADPAIGAASINLSGNELANSIYGNGGGNLLQGFAGNDILIAYGGDDSINGGAGNDIMAGGTGDDIYFVDSVNDDVVEVAGEGTDTIYASVSYGIGTGSSIERLIADPAFGSLALINLSGNEIANSLYGNNADNILSGGDGNDTLFGYLGSDVLQGGTGNDIMVGGGGDDIYFVDSINDQVIEEGEGGYDTVYTTVSYSAGVEYLAAADRLSTSAINLTGALRIDGNNGANVISSSANGSVLSGFGGDDRLDSSFGSGTLLGGTGNDTYVVRRVDTIVEYAGEGNDTVEINDNFFALGAGISIENLRASSNVVNIALQYTGNEISNAISGGNAGDTLSGGGGDDTLDGGLGNDTLVGGIGNDVYLIGDAGDVIIEALGEGNDTALVTLSSFTLAAGLSIETIRPGMGVDNLDLAITGNELANAITGTSGANIINGGGGDDRLSGMFGNDTLTGGSGSDTFFFGTPPQQGDFDTITDFTVGVDRIGLSTAAFGTLVAGSLAASAFVIGTAALDADDRVIYNAATGALFYDADGNGAGAAIQFAVLYGAPALTAADFTIG
jgi:Ca2+-binding RTX toxin-like protein